MIKGAIRITKEKIRNPEFLMGLLRGIEKYYRDYDIYQIAKLIGYIKPDMPVELAFGLAQWIDTLYELVADTVFEYEDYWGE